MKILGIDYGRRKIGLAIAEGPLSDPWMVVRYKVKENLMRELKGIIEKEKVEKIVVGISEGEMAEEIKEFAKELGLNLPATPIEMFDETLTSKDAQRLSIEAGINRKKRHEMEDAYAASLMLQNYLDFAK